MLTGEQEWREPEGFEVTQSGNALGATHSHESTATSWISASPELSKHSGTSVAHPSRLGSIIKAFEATPEVRGG